MADTATALFVNERDARLHRVLELTYFELNLKQEAAAERLGMSFSTYRRHLASSVNRLTEWLWQQEQQARNAEVPVPPGRDARIAPAAPAGRPRLSIVILPFLNLSEEPHVDYLVDGIVDSLITDLSTCIPGSFVISRSTAFTYKGRSVSLRQVGNELGVRYVLEGSVLVDAVRIRVNVQLIDADTDEHLWAERFDKERREICQVQDEIVGRLSRSIGIQLVRTEGFRGRAGDVIDLVMRARALISDTKRKETAAEAVELFQRAIRLDPDCVDARVGIGLTRIYQVINLFRLEGREELLNEAEAQLSRAAVHAPGHVDLLKARALLLRARGHFAEAIVATETLITRNPAEPIAYKEMGLNALYLGRTREAVEWFRRADQIAPRDPDRWTWLQGLGRALMQLGEDREAVAAMSHAMDSNPDYVRGKAMLAAAVALAGDHEAAARHFAEYKVHEPTMTVQQFARQRSSVPPDAVSQTYREETRRILEGLRLAGMPDDEIIFEHEMSSF